MSTIALLNNVGKDYVGIDGQIFSALKNVKLQINKGDFICIMGPSGSGKTTLSNLMGLLSKPSHGSLNFLGHECQTMNDTQLTALRRRHIGFIFQDYMLIEHMTAIENVSLSLHMDTDSKKQIHKRALELLEKVGLSDHAKKLPRQLSGGQKQRVAIARALIKKPDLILADEPAGALDPVSRGEVLFLLQELNSQGSTIVMVTHNSEDASAGTRLIKVHAAEIASDEKIQDRTLFKSTG